MPGEILANVILSGDKRFRDSVDEMGDQMTDSAGSASVLSGALGSVGGAATSVIGPSNRAASAIDEVGDEATQTGAEMGAASGQAGLLSTALLGMGTAGALASSSLTGVAGAIGLITVAIAPLLPVLSLAVGALGGLAIAFGAIMGSGLIAFNSEVGSLSKKLKDVWKQLKPLIVAFGSQFIPLIKDGLNAIVPFAKAMMNALGDLTPFTKALRALGSAAFVILPKLLGLFVDVARVALPMFHEIGRFIAANVVPALRALFKAGQQAAGPVARLGLALFELGKSLAPVAGIIGRVALSLYDMAAVGIGGLATGITSVVNALRRGISAFQAASAEVSLFAGATAETFMMLPGLVESGMGVLRALVSGNISALTSRWQSFMDELRMVTASGISGVWRMMSVGLMRVQALLRGLVGGWSDQFDAGMDYIRNAIADGVSGILLLLTGFGAAGRERLTRAVERWQQGVATAMPGLDAIIQAHLTTIQTAIGQFTTAVTTLWTLAFRQLPQPVQQALAVVETTIRGFVTSAITPLRQFAGMVRTAIAQPVQTFRTLRAELNQLLPPFLRIQTTATQLGTAIKTKLLPALAATGLLGIATTLAPILSGVLLPALTRLSGVGLRLAALFGGPVVSALRVLVGPLTRIGALITATLLPALISLASTVGGVLLSGLTSLGATLLSTATALTSVSGAISVLLGPIGLLVAAVAGLAVAWKTNLFNIRAIGRQVFSGLAALIRGDMTMATRHFRNATRAMNLSWTKNIRPLITDAKRIFSRIQAVVTQAMNWIVNNAVRPALQGLTRLWQTHMGHIEEDTRQLRTFLTNVFKAIGALIAVQVKTYMVLWNQFGDEILAVTKFVFDLVGSVIGASLDAVGTAIDAATDLMVGDWKGALSAIRGFTNRIFGGIIGFIRKWGTGLVNEIVSTGKTLKTGFVNQIIKLGNLVSQKFDQLTSWVARVVTGWVNGLIADVVGLKTDFVNQIIKLGNLAVDKFQSLKRRAKTVVSNMISSLISKAKGFVDDFTRPFTNAADAVKDKFDWLKKKVVGSSTVPEMLDQLVGVAKGSWADKFVAPFVDAADQIADRLASLKDQALSAVGMGGGGGTKFGKWAGERAPLITGGVLSGVPKNLGRRLREVFRNEIKGSGTSFAEYVRRAIKYGALGGGQFREDTPVASLPALASGGIVTSATPLIAGEGSEPEAITPLSHLDSMLADAGGSSGTQNVAVTLSVEGDSELADMIRRNIEANETDKEWAMGRSRTS